LLGQLEDVDGRLERRAITWFDYLWLSGESTVDEEATLGHLPESIRAEIATNVHADTLRRVALFRECETGSTAWTRGWSFALYEFIIPCDRRRVAGNL